MTHIDAELAEHIGTTLTARAMAKAQSGGFRPHLLPEHDMRTPSQHRVIDARDRLLGLTDEELANTLNQCIEREPAKFDAVLCGVLRDHHPRAVARFGGDAARELAEWCGNDRAKLDVLGDYAATQERPDRFEVE